MGKEKKLTMGVLGPVVFKKNGVADFNGLLAAIPKWLRTQGYDCLEKGRSEKSTSTGKTIESNWIAMKEVTAYVRYIIKINLFVRDLTDVAVEKHGKTVKMQRGRIELDFKSEYEKNYPRDGKKVFNTDKKYQEILRVFYERYVVKQQLTALDDKLLFESNDFVKHIQQFLYS